jgi:hypothetical protein
LNAIFGAAFSVDFFAPCAEATPHESEISAANAASVKVVEARSLIMANT